LADFKNLDAFVEMKFPCVGILKQAREFYTIYAYEKFEENYGYAISCYCQEIENNGEVVLYHVQRPNFDYAMHQVYFNKNSHHVTCTCRLFTSAGFLCAHSLHMLSVNNIDLLPESYFIPRWKRGANMACIRGPRQNNAASELELSKYSVWRMDVVSE